MDRRTQHYCHLKWMVCSWGNVKSFRRRGKNMVRSDWNIFSWILAFLLYRTRDCVTLYTQREDNSSIERCHDITAVRAQHCCLNPYFPELAFTVGDTVRLWTQDSLQTVRTDWKTRYSTRLQVSSVRWFSHSFHSFLYICSFSKWMAWTLFCSWRDWIGICLYHCGFKPWFSQSRVKRLVHWMVLLCPPLRSYPRKSPWTHPFKETAARKVD